MTPEEIAQGAELLRQMVVLKTSIDALDAAIENSSFLAGGPLVTDNPNEPIHLPPMTPEESEPIFTAVREALDARLKTVTDDLAAL